MNHRTAVIRLNLGLVGRDKPLPYETRAPKRTVGEGFIPSRDDAEFCNKLTSEH